MKYKKLLIVLTAVTALGIARLWKIIKGNSRGDTNTGSYSRTYGCTGYIHTASHIYTCTEADRCKDQYCKICLSYQQHEGRDP